MQIVDAPGPWGEEHAKTPQPPGMSGVKPGDRTAGPQLDQDIGLGEGRYRRYPAVDATFRRQTGIVPITPFGNGGSATDSRLSPSVLFYVQRPRVGADRARLLLPPFPPLPASA